MDAFKVFQDFFVNGRQFLVQANTPVLVCLLAPHCIRTSAAVFTGVDLHLSPVSVPGHCLSVGEQEPFPVGAYGVPVFISAKVLCAEWIFSVLLVFNRLFVHGELHHLFHPFFFAVKVVVVGSVSCICHRISGISLILFPELFHQRLETVLVIPVSVDIRHNDVFVCYSNLDVVSR